MSVCQFPRDCVCSGGLDVLGRMLILAERYLELLDERKVKGYIGMEKNYWPERGEKPAN